MDGVSSGNSSLAYSAFAKEERQLRHAAILADPMLLGEDADQNLGSGTNEMEVNILLRRDGNTISGRWSEAPTLKNTDRLLVQPIA